MSADIFDAVNEPREAPHPCERDGCDATVPFDDEPFCFTHSPETGSYRRGYSYRRTHAERN